MIDLILQELESLTYLFKELKDVGDSFQIPKECFKKVVNDKLTTIKGCLDKI